jgi:hypothetical protein
MLNTFINNIVVDSINHYNVDGLPDISLDKYNKLIHNSLLPDQAKPYLWRGRWLYWLVLQFWRFFDDRSIPQIRYYAVSKD